MPWQARTAVLMGISILSVAPAYASDTAMTIALVIDGSTKQEREPLRAYLAKAMGRPINIAAPDSYRETVTHLADGSYDFACLGALVYMRAHARHGVIPLVQRDIDLHYHTVFITRAGSSIHTLRDLIGTEFAFGDIDSTSAHLMAYRELKLAGINPETDLKLRYTGSHLATAALVETGAVEAGAIDKTVFDFLIANGKLDSRKVRVFSISAPYIDYLWVARKGVPEPERERFAHALLSLKEGRDDATLKTLRARKFVVASDEEYEKMRQIARDLGMF